MFQNLPAYQTLKKLAEAPIDLTHDLTPERVKKFTLSACGYKLLYATERVNDEVIQALFSLASQSKALEKMEAMQRGEVVNKIEGFPSEHRRVLHTATRDFFNPNPSPEAKEAAAQAKREFEKLQIFLPEMQKKFSDLVMIGIGGSDLGPRASYLALRYLQPEGRNVHFISNVDPDDAASIIKGLHLKKTIVAVVSKSGTTLETRANEELVRQRFAAEGLDPKEHFIAITGKDSPMDNPDKYLRSFYIWDWVGGRYSSTSMVGGVLMAFAFGLEVLTDWLKGASAMDKEALRPNNLPLLAALLGIWNRNFLGLETQAIIPYSQGLQRFPAHIQQLDMESNGKRVDKFGATVSYKTGPVIWGEPGTNAQHSFFQLIHQGTDVIPITFIGYGKSQYDLDVKVEGTTSQQKLLANLFAQAVALAQGKKDQNPNKVFPGNRPSHILMGSQLNPFSLGALLSFFEHRTAFQGFIWNINSFDQEGVELGKQLAKKMLNRILSQGEAYPLGDAFIKEVI